MAAGLGRGITLRRMLCQGFSTRVSVAVDAFRFRGHTLPFLPLPLSIVACANLVRLGVFLAFLKLSMNPESFLHNSATATEYAHMPNTFQLGQSESQAKLPPFFGMTRCGLLPL